MRTTLLGSLLDVARAQRRARRRRTCALFESGAVYLPCRTAPTRCPARAAPRSAVLLTGALRAGVVALAGAAAADFFAAKGVLAALLDALRRRLARRAGGASRSCIPGRAAAVLVGGAAGRLARRAAPAGRARSWDLDRRRRGASSSTSTL